MTIWGSTFVVTKEVMSAFPPLLLAFIRVAIGSAFLLPLAVLRRRASPGAALPWKTLLAMAFIGVAFYYFTFNLSLLYISASQGALVQSSIPAMTALVAVLWLRERASARRVIGIVLSVAGVLIVFAGGAAGEGPGATVGGVDSLWLGNLLMFGAVVAWGIYTSQAKRVAAFDPIVVTAYITAMGAVMLLPGALHEVSSKPLPPITPLLVLKVLYLGAIASGVAYLLYNKALQDMDASQVGVFANLIPIVGVITGVVLGDPLSAWSVAGGVVVMIGVWVTGSERAPNAPARAAATSSVPR